jgi:hypothetical protein
MLIFDSNGQMKNQDPQIFIMPFNFDLNSVIQETNTLR